MSTVEMTDRPQASSSVRSESPQGTDIARLIDGVISLLLLLLGVIGVAAKVADLKSVSLLLFAAIGLGTAVLQPVQRYRGLTFFVYGLSLSAVISLLTGFFLVEFHWWSAGTAIFIVFAAFAALAHVYGVATNASGGSEALATEFSGFNSSSLGVLAPALGIVGAAISLISALMMQHTNLTSLSGILGAFSPIWYIGLAAVTVSVILSRNLGGLRLGLSVFLLVLVVAISPAIMLNLPLFPWTFKSVGMTKFFMRNGRIRPGFGPDGGVYQSWPALFAGVAWLSHVTGIITPTSIARWWPTIMDLGWLVALRLLASRVGLSVRQAWFAAIFFFLSITIGQDYFSPQSISYFLALVIFAIAFKAHDEENPLDVPEWIILLAISCTIAFTHQLTPYMVTAALVVLLIFGFIRSWIIPIIAFVPSAIWTIAHSSSLKGLLSAHGLGGVVTNLQTPGSHGSELHNGIWVHLQVAGAVVAIGIVGVLALIVLIRKHTRLHWALAVAAASGVGLLFVTDYGNEGLFRVVLFASPWLAILAFSGRGIGEDASDEGEDPLTIASLVLLPVMVVAYLFGAMGIDFGYQTRQGDLNVMGVFEWTSAPKAVMFSIGYGSVPAYVTGHFNGHRYLSYEDTVSSGQFHGQFNAQKALQEFEVYIVSSGNVTGLPASAYPAKDYVYFSSGVLAQSMLRGVINPTQYAQFRQAFATSPYWRLVATSNTATLYKLNVSKQVIKRHIAPSR